MSWRRSAAICILFRPNLLHFYCYFSIYVYITPLLRLDLPLQKCISSFLLHLCFLANSATRSLHWPYTVGGKRRRQRRGLANRLHTGVGEILVMGARSRKNLLLQISRFLQLHFFGTVEVSRLRLRLQTVWLVPTQVRMVSIYDVHHTTNERARKSQPGNFLENLSATHN